MFSGIGGFELGIQRAFDKQLAEIEQDGEGRNRTIDQMGNNVLLTNNTPLCVGYSEIDKYAIQTYEKHFGKEVRNYGDCTKIRTEELPDFDMLVGGFPCQAFSIAGKRRGFEDTRGTMFFEVARIIKYKQPRLFVLENVKGLLNHDKGETFTTILKTIDELGYDAEWQVLNSKHFGVPQNRERVFIIGHLRGTSPKKVFPICGSGGETKGLVYAQKADREIARIHKPEGIAPTLHLKTGGWQEPKISEDMITVRRLTPVECERLQGFPDNWTEGVSDTQRYKQCGNAVTVNVVRAIFNKLIS